MLQGLCPASGLLGRQLAELQSLLVCTSEAKLKYGKIWEHCLVSTKASRANVLMLTLFSGALHSILDLLLH